VRVRVEDPLPPAGTVTGVGRLTVTPSGAVPLHAAERLTVEPNPSMEESSIVAELDVAGARLTTAGEG